MNVTRDPYAGRKTYHRGRWFVRSADFPGRVWSAPAYVSPAVGGRIARTPRVGMRGWMVVHIPGGAW